MGDSVENIIEEKKHKWKTWKNGEFIKGKYPKAKMHAKGGGGGVYNIKKSVNIISYIKKNHNTIFKIAKQIKKNSKDITGDTYIKDENRN